MLLLLILIFIETLLANGLSTFFIKGHADFSNSTKSLPENCSHCRILYNWVFDNFILAEQSYVKRLHVKNINNNSCGKLFSSLELPKTFDKNFKVS